MAEIKRIKLKELQNHKDIIRINKSSIHVNVVVATGKEGDFFVSISPSLNVSGYGKTKRESMESFSENMEVFCSDLMALPRKRIEIELRNMGFRKEKMQHKNFSKVYVDEYGVLQNFEEGSLETNMLKATTPA